MEKEKLAGMVQALKRANITPDDFKALMQMMGIMPAEKEEKEKQQLIDGMTNFTGIRNMYIEKEWIADDTGIYFNDGKHGPVRITDTPLLISARVETIETGYIRYQLAARPDGAWKYFIEDGDTLTTTKNIGALKKYGINFPSQTANALCSYISSCITANKAKGTLKTITATSKLGWHNGEFLPYDCNELVFDGEDDFPGVIDALKEHGDRERWFAEFEKLREREPIIFVSACALAAPLIKLIGSDGFVCDLYGCTGTGKTITNSIVASIWGDNSRLVATPDTTITATEAKLGVLNNLPLFVDDMNNMSEQQRAEYIQRLVMKISNGAGRARARKDGGAQPVRTWDTTALITSEFQATNQFKNGGSINRVFAYKIDNPIYSEEEINTLPDFFSDNYGFAGRDYIKALEEIGRDGVKKIFKDFNIKARTLAKERGKSDRQATVLAYILTADKIATDFVFKDGRYIDINRGIELLEDGEKVDTSARFYNVLMDTITINGRHFEGMTFDEGDIKEAQDNNRAIRLSTEYWGRYDGEKGYVYIVPLVIKELAKKEGADIGLFYQYCIKNGLMQKNKSGDKATTYRSLILLGANGKNKSVKGWKIKLPQKGEVEEDDMTPFERADAEIARIEKTKSWNDKADDGFPFK